MVLGILIRDKLTTTPWPSIPRLIIIRLAALIDALDESKRLPVSHNRIRSDLILKINVISRLMKRLYEENDYRLPNMPQREINLASDNFAQMSSLLYFPKTNDTAEITERVCSYLNIFTSGCYDQLP